MMYSEANIDAKVVEYELLTIKDFTVSGIIPKACYREFVCSNQHGQILGDPVDIKAFKETLIATLRETLQTEHGMSPAETEIVDI